MYIAKTFQFMYGAQTYRCLCYFEWSYLLVAYLVGFKWTKTCTGIQVPQCLCYNSPYPSGDSVLYLSIVNYF